jgi:cell division septum initiation protein DivIVA
MSYQQPDEARPAWMAERENEDLKAEVAALKSQVAKMAEAIRTLSDLAADISSEVLQSLQEGFCNTRKERDLWRRFDAVKNAALTPDAAALAEAWKRGQEAERILGSLFDTADEYLTVQTGFATGLIQGDENTALLNLLSCIGERVVAFRRAALEGGHAE